MSPFVPVLTTGFIPAPSLWSCEVVCKINSLDVDMSVSNASCVSLGNAIIETDSASVDAVAITCLDVIVRGRAVEILVLDSVC